MNQIKDLPPERNAGLDFNYSVWTPGTSAVLANVPWNSDYRDVVSFDSQADLDAYIRAQNGPVIPRLTYARVGEPIRINLPFNSVYRYNYIAVTNAAQPIPGDTARTFYYFIEDVVYEAPNTTAIYVTLDVWQSFIRDVSFGSCYIERGHIGVANENQFNDYGREFLTIPEGLDTGSEYMTRARYSHRIGGAGLSGEDDQCEVIVISTVNMAASGGTVDNPILRTAEGTLFEGIPNGCEIYHFPSMASFFSFMGTVANYPWISQGIVSVMAVPPIPSNELQVQPVSTSWGGTLYRLLNFKVKNQLVDMTGAYQPFRETIIERLPNRYRHLRKFLTYPYSVIEATTYTGNPLLLKPECIDGDVLKFVKFTHLAPPSPRVAFSPYRYNTGGLADTVVGNEIRDDGAEFLDMQVGIFNFPTFSVVNNGYMAFMASNANSLAYQHSSADWSQQKALRSSSLALQQANASIDLSGQNLAVGQSADRARQGMLERQGWQSAIVGGAANVLTGAATGGVPGAGMAVAGAAANAAMQGLTNQHNRDLMALDHATANQQAGNTSAYGRMVANQNYELARFASNGDYQQAIAGINAKVQDAQMIQPTTSGQVGGDAFNLVTVGWELRVRVKTMSRNAINTIGEFWLRYGYAVQRFGNIPDNFHCMSKFTYWKLMETYITSSACPEPFKQSIRGILEKGVTVWRNPADIGRIDIADNTPLGGIRL